MNDLLSYVIISEKNPLPVRATMESHTDVGAIFVTEEPFERDDRITACPYNQGMVLPEADEIRNHPQRIEGKIVRLGRHNQIIIQTEDQSIFKRSFNYQIDGQGLRTDLILQGAPTLNQFIKFHDQIKTHAASALQLIIDLTEVVKLPPPAYPILKKLIQQLLKRNKQVVLICTDCEQRNMLKDLPNWDNLELFSSRIDAQQFLKQNPPKILIIEDDQTTQVLLEQTFTNWNFHPIIADSAEIGLQKVKEDNPALILMDINLPGLNGIQATEELRNQTPTQDIPIIMLTSESRKDVVQQCLRHKVNGYVLKPIDPQSLLPKIIKILSQN